MPTSTRTISGRRLAPRPPSATTGCSGSLRAGSCPTASPTARRSSARAGCARGCATARSSPATRSVRRSRNQPDSLPARLRVKRRPRQEGPETMAFRTLDAVDVAGKRVLLRADLNVPVRDGKITDLTRIERLCPTIRELIGKQAKVIVCSHFDRPKGKRVPEMSLAPMAAALGEVLGQHVRFVEDCTGVMAEQAVELLRPGGVLVLENTRFHAGEEANEPAFGAALSKLADIFVNDAFSAAHRAHASTEGVSHLLPAYAGRLMQAELEALDAALGNPQRPVAAIVGGAKVSTKLELLGNLVSKVDVLVIGGAMANTFLAAQGKPVG